jgi:hypothetical protein
MPNAQGPSVNPYPCARDLFGYASAEQRQEPGFRILIQLGLAPWSVANHWSRLDYPTSKLAESKKFRSFVA